MKTLIIAASIGLAFDLGYGASGSSSGFLLLAVAGTISLAVLSIVVAHRS